MKMPICYGRANVMAPYDWVNPYAYEPADCTSHRGQAACGYIDLEISPLQGATAANG